MFTKVVSVPSHLVGRESLGNNIKSYRCHFSFFLQRSSLLKPFSVGLKRPSTYDTISLVSPLFQFYPFSLFRYFSFYSFPFRRLSLHVFGLNIDFVIVPFFLFSCHLNTNFNTSYSLLQRSLPSFVPVLADEVYNPSE